MNPEGLAKQAEDLTPEAQSSVGLLVAWLLSPLLDLDDTDLGCVRRDACLRTLEEAFEQVTNPDAMTRLAESVATSEELSQSEEPDVPALYRVDFMAILLYAIRTRTEDSHQELTWCLMAAIDCIDLAKNQGQLSESWDADEALLQVVLGLQSAGSAPVESLKEPLRPAYDLLRNAVQ